MMKKWLMKKKSALMIKKTSEIKKKQTASKANTLNPQTMAKKNNKVSENDAQSIRKKKLLKKQSLFKAINSNNLKKEIHLNMGKQSVLGNKINMINEEIIIIKKKSTIKKKLKVHHNPENRMPLVDLTKESNEYNVDVSAIVPETNDCSKLINSNYNKSKLCKKLNMVAAQAIENKNTKEYRTTALANKAKIVQKVTVCNTTTAKNEIPVRSMTTRSMSVKSTTSEYGERTIKEGVASNKRVSNSKLASKNKSKKTLLQVVETKTTNCSFSGTASNKVPVLIDHAKIDQLRADTLLYANSKSSVSLVSRIDLTEEDDQIGAASLKTSHDASGSQLIESLAFSKDLAKNDYWTADTKRLDGNKHQESELFLEEGETVPVDQVELDQLNAEAIQYLKSNPLLPLKYLLPSSSSAVHNIFYDEEEEEERIAAATLRVCDKALETQFTKSLEFPKDCVKDNDQIAIDTLGTGHRALRSQATESLTLPQDLVHKDDHCEAVPTQRSGHKASGSLVSGYITVPLCEEIVNNWKLAARVNYLDYKRLLEKKKKKSNNLAKIHSPIDVDCHKAKIPLGTQMASVHGNEDIDKIDLTLDSDNEEEASSPCRATNQTMMPNHQIQTIDSIEKPKASKKTSKNQAAEDLVLPIDQAVDNFMKENTRAVPDDKIPLGTPMASVHGTEDIDKIDLTLDSDNEEEASSPCRATNQTMMSNHQNQIIDSIQKLKASKKTSMNQAAEHLFLPIDQAVDNFMKGNTRTVPYDKIPLGTQMASVHGTEDIDKIDLTLDSDNEEEASSPCKGTNQTMMPNLQNQTIVSVQKPKASKKASKNQVAEDLVLPIDQAVDNFMKGNTRTVPNDKVPLGTQMASVRGTEDIDELDLTLDSDNEEEASSSNRQTNQMAIPNCKNQAVGSIHRANTENKLDWFNSTIKIINHAMSTLDKIGEIVL